MERGSDRWKMVQIDADNFTTMEYFCMQIISIGFLIFFADMEVTLLENDSVSSH